MAQQIAKEKAIYLVDKFYNTTPNEAWFNPPLGSLSMEYKAWSQAKECALIAVDEVLDSSFNLVQLEFFMKVKQEIEKL